MALLMPAFSSGSDGTATRMRTAALAGIGGIASVSIAIRFRIVKRDAIVVAHQLWSSTAAVFERKTGGGASASNYVFSFETHLEGNDILDVGHLFRGRWHVLLFTFTAGSQAVYVDGQLKDVGVLPGTFPVVATLMEVGVSGGSHDVEYWDICIWDKVLNTTERLGLRHTLLGHTAAADRVYNWEFTKINEVIAVNTTTHAAFLNELVAGSLDLSTITSGTPRWDRANAFGATVPGNRSITARQRGTVNRRSIRSR